MHKVFAFEEKLDVTYARKNIEMIFLKVMLVVVNYVACPFFEDVIDTSLEICAVDITQPVGSGG